MTIRGIAFPFNKGTTSFPDTSQDDVTVEDNIRRIVMTRRGERVMRDAGSDVMNFVFENVGPLMAAKIRHEVRRAVAAGEPRAQVLGVSVVPRENNQTKGTEVLVVISYRLHGEQQQTIVKL